MRRRSPVTVTADATVQEACRQMRSHRVGAVLVLDQFGALEGIFTGRDAVRLLAEGRGPGHAKLHDIMTRNPVTVTSQTTAIEALRLMQDGGFRHLPIVEHGRLLDVVSHGDFPGREHARLDEETCYWEQMR
jgi:CBS domain-containing protein